MGEGDLGAWDEHGQQDRCFGGRSLDLPQCSRVQLGSVCASCRILVELCVGVFAVTSDVMPAIIGALTSGILRCHQ